MHDELIHFLKSVFVEELMDSFSSGQLTRFVLTLNSLLTAGFFCLKVATLEFLSLIVSIHIPCGYLQLLTSCFCFSQSARNFSSPMSVKGCLRSCSMTFKGIVAMWAPIRAVSRMCTGWRTEATKTSVGNS